VWVLDATGKPKAVSIHLGITDGSYTEITSGDLTEQQQVIVGLGGERTSAHGATGPGGPRLKL